MSPSYAARFDLPMTGEYDISDAEVGMVAKTKEPLHWTGWITTVIAIIALVGGALWMAHSEITRITDRLDGTEKRMGRLETAIRIMSVGQGGNTKQLVDEALSVAELKVHEGSIVAALRTIDLANTMIDEEKRRQAPASGAFFETTFNKYTALGVAHPAIEKRSFEGKIKLAEYRTSLTAAPITPRSYADIGQLIKMNGWTILNDSTIVGEDIQIDNFLMKNVVIRNARVVYRGGPLRMQNVWFVNCTFDVSDTPTGNQLLKAAASAEPTLAVG